MGAVGTQLVMVDGALLPLLCMQDWPCHKLEYEKRIAQSPPECQLGSRCLHRRHGAYDITPTPCAAPFGPTHDITPTPCPAPLGPHMRAGRPPEGRGREAVPGGADGASLQRECRRQVGGAAGGSRRRGSRRAVACLVAQVRSKEEKKREGAPSYSLHLREESVMGHEELGHTRQLFRPSIPAAQGGRPPLQPKEPPGPAGLSAHSTAVRVCFRQLACTLSCGCGWVVDACAQMACCHESGMLIGGAPPA